jgi:hypothetical protein
MEKKGQISLFIILGIVILIMGGLIVFIKTDYLRTKLGLEREKSIVVPPQLKVVTDHIDNCLETTSIESLYQLGQYGGYYNVPKDISIVFFKMDIPYYYLDKQGYVPSLERIEKELADSISDNLKSCLNFNDFRGKGFNISEGDLSVSTKIDEKKVNIEINYPVKIEKAEIVLDLKDFEFDIDSNFKSLHDTAKEIVVLYSKKPGFVCLTCLEELSVDNNVGIVATPILDVSVFENNIIWFLITDKEYMLNDKDFSLRFIVEQ